MIYTQEPWEIQNGSIGPYIIAKDGNGNHVTVAQIFSRGVADCETKGNARLVKAAPKMYEALVKYGSALMFLEGNFKERFSKTELESLQQAYRKGFEVLAEVEGKGE